MSVNLKKLLENSFQDPMFIKGSIQTRSGLTNIKSLMQNIFQDTRLEGFPPKNHTYDHFGDTYNYSVV